ncbi:MAG TPA: hypothetical protein VNZ47_02410, partial [Candidatus Dormibacteraeota bacterium]|nr:hypothetical protein [Candidatus Dormibacteraeota bacterium]
PRCRSSHLLEAENGGAKQQGRYSTLFDFPGHRSNHGRPPRWGPIPLPEQVQKLPLLYVSCYPITRRD